MEIVPAGRKSETYTKPRSGRIFLVTDMHDLTDNRKEQFIFSTNLIGKPESLGKVTAYFKEFKKILHSVQFYKDSNNQDYCIWH